MGKESVMVLAMCGKPLMPTSPAKARVLLKQGRAKVKTSKPFAIQLAYETAAYTQPIALGVDSGFMHIGFSAVAEGKELLSGSVALLPGVSERLEKRSSHRGNRRQRLRHRPARFGNRAKPEGWLAPSVQHKLDSHVRLVEKLASLLPITSVTVEVAAFDIQQIKDPGIKGIEYQQGEQLGHKNVREYVLYRDGHKCQNPKCKNGDKSPKLVAHHIEHRCAAGSERPGNMATLCTDCNSPANHKGYLKDWKPKSYEGGYRAETFMTSVRWKLIDALREKFVDVAHTYGYLTKHRRTEQGLAKTHANDAFCIAGGKSQERCSPQEFEQTRRNNRSLEKFYDAKHVDTRTGKTVKAGALHCGRTTRNKDRNGENLRAYRGRKLSKGRRSIRTQRHPFQPGDLVKHEGRLCTVKGTHNKGTRAVLKETGKSVAVAKLESHKYRKGIA